MGGCGLGGVDGGPERAERSAGRGIELEIWESGFSHDFFTREEGFMDTDE